MGPIDLIFHLFNFVAPALVVALLVGLCARFVMPNRGLAPVSIARIAINFIACLAVLLLGLWFFGRDGKMATYAVMVLVSATCQWVMGRGWRA
ncbi:MAG: hypothetical protein RIS34_318 [Pseudomonadota bacterium]|jgi:FtsH-binding integral membrane protein